MVKATLLGQAGTSKKKVSQAVCLSCCQSARQSVCHVVSQPVSQACRQPVGQSVSLPVDHLRRARHRNGIKRDTAFGPGRTWPAGPPHSCSPFSHSSATPANSTAHRTILTLQQPSHSAPSQTWSVKVVQCAVCTLHRPTTLAIPTSIGENINH